MPEEIVVKVTANDSLIEVATGKYPVSLEVIRLKHTNCSFSANPPLRDLQELGYDKVKPTLCPSGDVVTEGTPLLVDGVWTRTWEIRSFTQEELTTQLTQKKEELTAQVMRTRDDDFEMGVTYSPKEGVEFNVQLRSEDRVNLLMLSLEAKAALASGSENTQQFRSYENETFDLTPGEIVEMTDLALGAIKSIYQTSWASKDQIESAVKLSDLPTLPRTFIVS